MSKPLDRLALLQTFVRIAERGTISGAARDLGLAQGSASRQLKDLEDRLGVQLVRRTTHELALTEAGLDVLADARELLARWEALEERQAEDAGALRGALSGVAPVAMGQMALADVAVAFQAAHPQVTLTWRLEDEAIRFAEVGCDCWIKIGPVTDERLVVRRLGRVERLVAATPGLAARMESATPAAAAALPFAVLTPFEGRRIRVGRASGERAELAVTPALSTNNILSLKRAVLAGLGAAVLPRWFVAEELTRGALVDLLPEWRAATLDVNIAYLPARRRPRRLTAFIEAVAAGVAAMPGVSAP
ncbi:MAG: LysR family transcriptional regulator [Pseudomonadota bacterium]